MLFCLSEKLISLFGVQCPPLSSSWESLLCFPREGKRVVSHHTGERGLRRVHSSIRSNSELTGTGLLPESLLHSTEIRGFSQGRQRMKPAGVNLFLRVWHVLQCIDAALFCKKNIMPFMVKKKLVVELWHSFPEQAEET